MRLLERALRDHVVAAGGAVRFDLQPGRAQLALGDVEVALRVVKRGRGHESLCLEVLRARILLTAEDDIRLRLHESLLGGGQRDFAQLPDPGFGLRDCGLRLRERGARVLVVQHDQDISAAYALAFVDRDAGDRRGDHRSDGDPLRRHDPPARHHRLHEIGARHLKSVDRRPEDLIAKDESRRDQHHEREHGALHPGGAARASAWRSRALAGAWKAKWTWVGWSRVTGTGGRYRSPTLIIVGPGKGPLIRDKGGITRRRCAGRELSVNVTSSLAGARVEPDGHRAVVDQRDPHVGAELAGGNRRG